MKKYSVHAAIFNQNLCKMFSLDYDYYYLHLEEWPEKEILAHQSGRDKKNGLKI